MHDYGICGTVLGYAYNTEAGAPIRAGKASDESSTKALPVKREELAPFALGVLALGALGLPLWRRKKADEAAASRN